MNIAINFNTAYISIQATHINLFFQRSDANVERRLNMLYEHDAARPAATSRGFYLHVQRESMGATSFRRNCRKFSAVTGTKR